MASNHQKQPCDGRVLRRSQLVKSNKEELIDVLLVSDEDGCTLTNINIIVNDIMRAVDALKNTLSSQNIASNKNYEEVKVDQQAEIMRQQQYFENLDRECRRRCHRGEAGQDLFGCGCG